MIITDKNSKSNKISIREMKYSDLKNVENIQFYAYKDLTLESYSIIEERYSVSKFSSWIAEDSQKPVGYLIAFWYAVGKIQPIEKPFYPSKDKNCLYIHDLAILPDRNGAGIGRKLFQAALKYAKHNNCKTIALLSVQNSKKFWEKFNFKEYKELKNEQILNLKNYSLDSTSSTIQNACYMIKKI